MCVLYSATAGKISRDQLRPHILPLIVKCPLHNEHIFLSYTKSTFMSTLITGREAIKEIKIIPRVLGLTSPAAAP